MGYLEIEDRRTRDYIKEEIVNTIMRFAEDEKNYDEKFVSINESGDSCTNNEIEKLSYEDDYDASLYEATSDNILDTLESEELIKAISHLDDSEIDLITRLYVKDEDEYEIALNFKTTVENIRLRKMKILSKIRNRIQLIRE